MKGGHWQKLSWFKELRLLTTAKTLHNPKKRKTAGLCNLLDWSLCGLLYTVDLEPSGDFDPPPSTQFHLASQYFSSQSILFIQPSQSNLSASPWCSLDPYQSFPGTPQSMHDHAAVIMPDPSQILSPIHSDFSQIPIDSLIFAWSSLPLWQSILNSWYSHTYLHTVNLRTIGLCLYLI